MVMRLPCRTSLALLVFVFVIIHKSASVYGTSDDAFVLTSLGCLMNTSGNNCPKKWKLKGGPHYTGTQREQHDAQIFCSPSCTDNSNPKECSLIVVMHGIYSNPGDMIWLMIGSDDVPNWVHMTETYNEDDAHGGPFCISFVKASGYPWIYSPRGIDAEHLFAHIEFMKSGWPIAPDAVYLHGYSSGGIAIHHLMNTESIIEPLVAGAATYGSGNVINPPTTNAAYAVVMPTHDNIVAYRNVWIGDKSFPSCDCNAPGFTQPGGCMNGAGFYLLNGEELVTAIGNLRGTTPSATSVFDQGPLNAATKTELDLNFDEYDKCISDTTTCIGPFKEDVGYSCSDLPSTDTVVHDFVVSDPNAGPLQLWEMRLRNHDYPSRRRAGNGPTEFFFQLKKFFRANRGIKTVDPGGVRSLTTHTNRICSNTIESFYSHPHSYNVKTISIYDSANPPYTEEECMQHCLRERRCVEAFYFYTTWFSGYTCQIHYVPCPGYIDHFWPNSKHYVATVDSFPTGSPIPTESHIPTESPSVSKSPSQTPSFVEGICLASQTFHGNNFAGYSCLVGDTPNGQDSNWGGTQQSCEASGGVWTPYDCFSADGYYTSVIGHDHPDSQALLDVWRPQCCSAFPPTDDGICLTTELLEGFNVAGYSCSDGTDSNFGGSEQACLYGGFTWTEYDCRTADAYFQSDVGHDHEYAQAHLDVWRPKCCANVGSTPPTQSPSKMTTTTPSITITPTSFPSATPTVTTSEDPTGYGSDAPSAFLSEAPSNAETETHSNLPSAFPSEAPSNAETEVPSNLPSAFPSSDSISLAPSMAMADGSDFPTAVPSAALTEGWNEISNNNFDNGWGDFKKGRKRSKHVKRWEKGGAKTFGDGIGSLWIRAGDGSKSSFVSKRKMDVQSYSKVKVHFKFSAFGLETNETFVVESKGNNEKRFTTVETYLYNADHSGNSIQTFTFPKLKKWYDREVEIDTASLATLMLRFRCKGSDKTDKVFFDDIWIGGQPSGDSRVTGQKVGATNTNDTDTETNDGDDYNVAPIEEEDTSIFSEIITTNGGDDNNVAPIEDEDTSIIVEIISILFGLLDAVLNLQKFIP